jgi:hypothetical protein
MELHTAAGTFAPKGRQGLRPAIPVRWPCSCRRWPASRLDRVIPGYASPANSVFLNPADRPRRRPAWSGWDQPGKKARQRPTGFDLFIDAIRKVGNFYLALARLPH